MGAHMEHTDSICGALLLAGGASRRMGTDKTQLLWHGERFILHIARQLSGFDEKLLSVNTAASLLPQPWTVVRDIYPGCGPMGGLQAGLSVCRSPWLFAVSCDLPLLDSSLASFLTGMTGEKWDAVIPVTPDGRTHPLCAVYRKNLSALFEANLCAGKYGLMDTLSACSVRYVALDAAFAKMTGNVNTPADYQALLAGTL